MLLALTNPAHQHHTIAHAWLSGVERFLTTPVTEIGLLRLLLNPAVTGQAVSARQALDVLSGVKGHERAEFTPDTGSLAEPAIDLVGLVGHRQVTDLHLVDLARRAGCTLATFDRRLAGALVAADRALVTVL